MTSQKSQSNSSSRPEIREPHSSLMGDGENQIDRSDITSFVTTMQPLHEDLGYVTSNYSDLLMMDSHDHSISTVLARPQLQPSVTWPASAKRNAILARIPTENLLTDLNISKVMGFGFIRYSSVLRGQVNLPPTTQGLLRCSFIPGGASTYARQLVGTLPDSTATTMYLSSLQHVELNINDQQEFTLKVPFVYNYPYLPTTSNDDTSYGEFIIWVYSPLLGVDTCDIIIWSHMEDVSVCGPTSLTFKDSLAASPFQSGWSSDNLKIVDDDEDNRTPEEKPNLIIDNPPTVPVSNSSSSFNKILGANEIGNGVISGVSKVAANIFWAISAVFPPIQAYTLPAAGILSGASRIAKLFGFGKKANARQSQPVYIKNLDGFATTDGFDDCQVIGIYNNSDLEPKELFGTTIDEMNINYITSHSAFLNASILTDTQPAGTLLAVIDSNLTSYYSKYPQTLVGPSNWRQYLPVSSLTPFFKYWRGERYLHIKVVKNRFQATRLVVCYDPLATPDSSPPYTISNYTYKITLDLKDKSEFVIQMPFITNKEWIKNGDSCGMFYIYNLDKLVVGGGTSNSIELIYEISGAPSLEFAFPTAPVVYPGTTTVPKVNNGMEKGPYGEWTTAPTTVDAPLDLMRFECTSDDVSRNHEILNFIEHPIPPASHPNESHITLRNLMHRYMACFFVEKTSTPFSFRSYINMLSNFYAFWRGSFRIKCAPYGKQDNNLLILGLGVETVNPIVYEHVSVKGSVCMQVPYYCDSRLANCDTIPASYTLLDSSLSVHTNDDSWKLTSLSFAVAAGEDFQCGAWRGVQPYYNNDLYDPINDPLNTPYFGPQYMFYKINY